MNWNDWYDNVFLKCKHSKKENKKWICKHPDSLNGDCLSSTCPNKNSIYNILKVKLVKYLKKV